ncbi:hypothetical protein BDR07DRAFT_1381273 [Suillus spraguei]|nr:hypothetical protein BDR07DRAFT_1381273 [Suillus spraguei]
MNLSTKGGGSGRRIQFKTSNHAFKFTVTLPVLVVVLPGATSSFECLSSQLRNCLEFKFELPLVETSRVANLTWKAILVWHMPKSQQVRVHFIEDKLEHLQVDFRLTSTTMDSPLFLQESCQLYYSPSQSSMKQGRRKMLSPSNSSASRHHQDNHEHIQRATDKVMSNIGQRHSTWWFTTGDHTLFSKGKEILSCGLQQMSDHAVQKATLVKQASREIRCLWVMLTAWEIEEAEHHTELLCELQHSNVEGYQDATQEAVCFEKFLSDRSLMELKDDFDFNETAYPHDLALLATTDNQLNQLESHTKQRDLILSKEELKNQLKVLIIEGGEGSETDDGILSNLSDDH